MKSVNKHDFWPSWLQNLMSNDLWKECEESSEEEEEEEEDED